MNIIKKFSEIVDRNRNMCYNSDIKEKWMNTNENCEFVQKNIEREVQQCIILKQKSNAKA